VLAVLFALSSSLMYALASVLQQRGAADQPAEQNMKIGLLVRLVQNPGWVVGLACDVVGYVLQFLALGHGPIVVVQPLLVCGLLFALPIGAAWAGRRLSRSDWIASLMVCAGLAVFLTVGNPQAGRPGTSALNWSILLTTITLFTAGLVGVGVRSEPRRKAVLLAAAAGAVYGAAAALTKTASHLLSHGIVPLLTHWETYVLVVFGVVGMLLAQSAFQAEALDVSLPTMTVGDPIVSVAIGASVLHETISSSPAAVVAEVLALMAMVVGVFLLARGETRTFRAGVAERT
jgi:drug/metabolite transporter (DMT)-like permease